ncbi:GyrI-like domain-containing protein [Methylobacterium sp. NMS12]|uniref:GyrI-like domain-containing protein n=1 Tax=Methylobacterium sp. NMS12 TaxID=3079766 RepID=UPI003F88599B
MDEASTRHRTVSCRPLLIAGVVQHCQAEHSADLPRLWRCLDPHLAAMGCVEKGAYFGIPHARTIDGRFRYLVGVEVVNLSDVPENFSAVQLASHRYAAFTHSGHVSTASTTLAAIRSYWLPRLGLVPASALYLERYDTEFDKLTGWGGFEFWMPLQQSTMPDGS